MARVDVIMPVRNGAAFIEEAIRSVMAQTERDWRLLVLNHASTDATGDIIEQLRAGDSRIEHLSCAPGLTLSDVRNQGFDRSDAPFVMLHDADDVSEPDRMAASVEALERQPGLALIGSDYRVVSGDGAPMGRRHLPTDPARIAVASIFSNPIPQPAVTMRMDDIRRLNASYGSTFLRPAGGPAPMHVATLVEDYLLFGQLAIERRCGSIARPLLRYRWHGGNQSSVKFEPQMILSHDVARHLVAILAAEHGSAWLDPIPFSNFGGRIEPVATDVDLGEAWQAMRDMIVRVFGDTPGVRRELAFRQVLATRSLPQMLARFAAFRLRHRPDGDEVATIRSFAAATIRRTRR